MKVLFGLEDSGGILYLTKEEWDENRHSEIGWRRIFKAPMYLERYTHEPDRFPCICFEGFTMNNRNGADLIPVFFIYDFQHSE